MRVEVNISVTNTPLCVTVDVPHGRCDTCRRAFYDGEIEPLPDHPEGLPMCPCGGMVCHVDLEDEIARALEASDD